MAARAIARRASISASARRVPSRSWSRQTEPEVGRGAAARLKTWRGERQEGGRANPGPSARARPGGGLLSATMVGRSLLTLLCVFAPAPASARDFVVTSFGAVGDATAEHPGTNNTAAVRKAAAALAAAGGGALVFPAGNFSTGAFNLSSNMVLRLEPGAVVSGIQPRSLGEAAFDYPVVPWDGTGGADAYGGASDFQGELGPQYQSFIHGYQLSNVTIEGGGTIWGGGDFWWQMWAGHGNQAKGSSPLNMSRPHTVHLVGVKGLTIRDISVRRSPSWTLHLTFCSDVLVDSIRIQTNDSKADGGNAAFEPANADGLDIDSCRDVVVRNSTFYTHDDGIALKSGKDWFGRHVGRPTENVLIENCVSSSPDGAIVFGSEMSGGLRNITVRNHRAIRSGMGLWIKSMRNRGGIVEEILFDGIEMDGIRLQLANVDMFYSCGKQTQHACNASATPIIRNVRFQNIVAKNVVLREPSEASLFWLRGLPESSIHGIAIENVSVSGLPPETKVVLATDATFTSHNVVLDGKPHSAATPTVPQDPDCSLNTPSDSGGSFASGSNWTNCRRKLVAEMFGTDGTLPSRSTPDDIIHFDAEQMHGLPAPGDGDRWNSSSSNSSSVAWKNNLTKLVWKLTPLGGGDDALTIDSPGSCPAAKWYFEAGLLKLGGLCATVPAGAMPQTAVALQACASDHRDSHAGVQQHWTRDADSRFHLGNASAPLCLNGYMPYTPPNTKLQVYPCSATPTANEKFTIASNGSLISAAGGCVRNLRTAPVQLNATVWHTLNTSAVAPGNYPPLDPGMPRQRQPPPNFQKTLLLYLLHCFSLSLSLSFSLSLSVCVCARARVCVCACARVCVRACACARVCVCVTVSVSLVSKCCICCIGRSSYHNGHETATCSPNYDGVVDYFNELGYGAPH